MSFLTNGCCVAAFVSLCDHLHIPIKNSRWRLNWEKGQAAAMDEAILGAYFWKLMLNRNRQYIPE